MGGRAVGGATVLAAGVVLLVFFVALGSDRSSERVGRLSDPVTAPAIGGDLVVVGAALALAMLGWLTYLALRSRVTPTVESRANGQPWWMTYLVLFGLMVFFGAIVLVEIVFGHRPAPLQRPSAPPVSDFEAVRRIAGRSGAVLAVHWWMLAALGGTVVAAVVARRSMRAPRRRPPAVEARRPHDQERLLAAIAESITDLERERDSRRAVIRAYVGMEQALSWRGVGRQPFEAPVEYLTRALGAMRVSRPAAQRLTALFERARFSEHPVDREMKREAIAALATVRDELMEGQRT